MTVLNFDLRNVKPDDGFGEPLPPGWYNAKVDETEVKPTKAGDGYFLNVRFEVLDGDFQGRKFFNRYNIQNQSAKAVEIGMGQLSALAHATNVLMIQDSAQLHNIPVKVKLKISPAREQYAASNEVVSIRNINEPVDGVLGATAPAVFGGPAAAPAAAPAVAPAAWGGAPAAAPAVAPAATVVAQPWAGAPAAATAPAAAPAAVAPAAGAAPGGVPPWAQK